MNAKTILNKFLSTTLAVALLFSLSPLAATATEPETADAATAVSADTPDDAAADTPAPQYSENDYAYMYLVTEKTYVGINISNKEYHSGHTYEYDDYGLVVKSTKTYDQQIEEDKVGDTIFEYSDGKLANVEGPFFIFSYTYNKKGNISKYDMSSFRGIAGYDGPDNFRHNIKYRKKDRSAYNPKCGALSLLSRGDRYFFNKKHKPQKMYKQRQGKAGYSEKEYYTYDKKGNIKSTKVDHK